MIWTGPVIGAGVLLLCATAEFGVIVGQAKTIGSLRAQVQGNQVAIAQSAIDLNACTETKGQYSRSLAECLTEVRVAGDENAAARASIAQLSDHIRQESAHVRREREVIYSMPGCQELSTMDLAGVCPSLAVSLRARAAEMSAPRKGPDTDPGGP